jgi:hypothetical protein
MNVALFHMFRTFMMFIRAVPQRERPKITTSGAGAAKLLIVKELCPLPA